MQYAQASTDTNIGSIRFVQTEPMQYSEDGTNTNLTSNRLTNTPSQNHISTHNDRCKCEEDEMNLKYKSNFARQLQQSGAIPDAQPVTNYNSERRRQNRVINNISYTRRINISNKQPAIQYTQQPVTNDISEGPR